MLKLRELFNFFYHIVMIFHSIKFVLILENDKMYVLQIYFFFIKIKIQNIYLIK